MKRELNGAVTAVLETVAAVANGILVAEDPDYHALNNDSLHALAHVLDILGKYVYEEKKRDSHQGQAGF